MLLPIPCSNGGIAQLVEHKLCKLGVTGSNPVASTSFCQGAVDRPRQGKAGPESGEWQSFGRVAQSVRAQP